MRALILAFLATTGCVRAPAPIDVQALVARRGAVEARRDLAMRVLDDPRDVGARLALAALAEQVGRPSEAIEQLEAVERLGGPLGTRWHAEDRARLARLLLARGRARLVRSAPTALADLKRAASLGAAPTADELLSATIAVATAQIRHVDAKERAAARAVFAAHAKPAKGDPTDESSWLGARATASPAERGAFGAWLWSIGAKRESYEQLAVWHAATAAPRDAALQSAYLRALAWWSPVWLGEVAPPPVDDLVGPERCHFPGTGCTPPAIEPLPLPPIGDLGPEAATLPRVAAVARYAATRSTAAASGDQPRALATIAAAYLRDPVIADRLARDLVATSIDAAAARATLGALFDALGDPVRARAAWQEAVALASEPAYQRGLAEATAREGDGPAAHVFATTAAAASGDPAVVYSALAVALIESKQYVDAMTAARRALDLAGTDELARALDLAIAVSRHLGRTSQADALLLQRAQLAPRAHSDEADVASALLEHRNRPTAATAARLWVVARAQPRNVPLRAALVATLASDDPRRATIVAELVSLAGDESPERAYAAVLALR